MTAGSRNNSSAMWMVVPPLANPCPNCNGSGSKWAKRKDGQPDRRFVHPIGPCDRCNGKRELGIVLEVHGWHTQCGFCGYGRGSWADSPAREGKPILGPESRTCHGCGKTFTHKREVVRGGRLTVLTQAMVA